MKKKARVKKPTPKPRKRVPVKAQAKSKPRVKETRVMSDKVKLEALEYHTHDGKEYQAGDTYSADAAVAESIVAQRKAKFVEEAKPSAAKKSQPVEPMTMEDFTGKKK